VLPLVAFGRRVQKLSRGAQDTLAEASSYASELIGAIRTLQAFTNERLAETRFGGEVERAYVADHGRGPQFHARARLSDRDRDLPDFCQRGGDPVDRVT